MEPGRGIFQIRGRGGAGAGRGGVRERTVSALIVIVVRVRTTSQQLILSLRAQHRADMISCMAMRRTESAGAVRCALRKNQKES